MSWYPQTRQETLRFNATRLQQLHDANPLPATLSDEVESFALVLTRVLACYAPNKMSAKKRREFFDCYYSSQSSMCMFRSGSRIARIYRLTLDSSSSLDLLVRSMIEYETRYKRPIAWRTRPQDPAEMERWEDGYVTILGVLRH